MKTEKEIQKKLAEVKKNIERATNEWISIHLRYEEIILEWILKE